MCVCVYLYVIYKGSSDVFYSVRSKGDIIRLRFFWFFQGPFGCVLFGSRKGEFQFCGTTVAIMDTGLTFDHSQGQDYFQFQKKSALWKGMWKGIDCRVAMIIPYHP